MTEADAGQAGRELSRLGAAKGGRARASVLTAEERSELARKAVQARWQKSGKPAASPSSSDKKQAPPPPPVPGDTLPYSMFPGTLRLGDVSLQCHVLNDGRRVFTQGEVVRALTGGTDSSNLNRYLSRIGGFDASALPTTPFQFRVPGNPQPATGYEATLLIEICEAYLNARDLGLLRSGQGKLAQAAEVIIRACAKVGIIALIDEATGYQEVRAKHALQIKLQAFIADEMQEWAKMFPDEFWYELARLEGIHYSPRHRPLRWGKYVMMFVYDAVDPDVGQELRSINPNPAFLHNHHQWLKKHGQDSVRHQIGQVVGVMKTCNSMDEFRRKFAHVFKRSPLQLELAGIDWTT
jgi:P63C domain